MSHEEHDELIKKLTSISRQLHDAHGHEIDKVIWAAYQLCKDAEIEEALVPYITESLVYGLVTMHTNISKLNQQLAAQTRHSEKRKEKENAQLSERSSDSED